MAVEAQDIAVGSGEHIVQFYEHDSELLATVGPYLTAGAQTGDVAIVIATEAHRRALEVELEASGIELAQARAGGRLFSLDAATTMAALVVAGQIDRDAFHEVIGGLVRKASESGRPVRAYGEMVALLWDAGDVLAAIELETLWNDLAGEMPFSLFCSYPAASVCGSEHADALHQVCRLHSSVLRLSAGRRQDTAVEYPEIEVTAEFAAERDSPGCARRLVVAALRESGHDETLVQDAALVVSELATNAVVHANSSFSITARLEDSVLRIAVQDARPLAGSAREQGLAARTGHGLGLIDVLADRWGVESVSDGKAIWAELTYEPPVHTVPSSG